MACTYTTQLPMAKVSTWMLYECLLQHFAAEVGWASGIDSWIGVGMESCCLCYSRGHISCI
jgi:hypothetical protein